MKEFREDFLKSSEDYKSSLQSCWYFTKNDVTELTEHSANGKELYAKGLSSRREYETKTGRIAETQIKVDEVL